MEKYNESKKLYKNFKLICPGGVHSNARFSSEIGHPVYFSRAQGSRLWDIDENEYIDCLINFGAILLGHNYPKISEAVKEAITVGLTCGVETELSYKVSKKLVEMIPSAEFVKFSTTGTEAIMHAIQIVRGYTGKELIMKLEGSYSGWYDPILVSNQPPENVHGPLEEPNVYLESKGLSKKATEQTIVFPFNNIDIFNNLVKKYKENLAGVILTPVVYSGGCMVPEEGYLKALREITEDNDIPLVFDEVITGFRAAPGGAQELFGITPDLSVFAKAIANGYPCSAVVGKKDIMNISAPGGGVHYGGTQNGNQIALAAASVCLDEYKNGKIQTYIKTNAEKITKTFNELSSDLKISAQMITSCGMFNPFFSEREIKNHRDRMTNKKTFKIFWNELFRKNIFFRPEYFAASGLTSAHVRQDIEKIEYAIQSGLEKIKNS